MWWLYFCLTYAISVSSNPTRAEVYLIKHYVIACLWLAAGRWFSPGTRVFSTNKADRHDITVIIVESGIKHHNL
jgi:hypothetical protein